MSELIYNVPFENTESNNTYSFTPEFAEIASAFHGVESISIDADGTVHVALSSGDDQTFTQLKTRMDGFVPIVSPNFVNSVNMGRKAGTTTGTKSVALGNEVTATGGYSFAEGDHTTAGAVGAHAEGLYTTASSEAAHAEGFYATASGRHSHAEGESTTASGMVSHAEGGGTTASGFVSHAEGSGTISNSKSQHVFGAYNIADSNNTPTDRGTYIEIVGNGSSEARSNARSLDWSGNEYLAGDVYANCNSSGANGKKLATEEYVVNWMNYSPISISTLTINPSVVETGTTVSSVTFTYVMNKVPTSATLDGTAQPISAASGNFTKSSLSVTAKKTWTLQATETKPDGTSNSSSKTVTLYFYNAVFYGAAADQTITPGTNYSTFVRGLENSKVDSDGKVNFTVTAGANQYIWYASVSNACSFNVNGFDGGFEPAVSIKVNNAGGTATTYYLYRSTNANLGTVSVTVK